MHNAFLGTSYTSWNDDNTSNDDDDLEETGGRRQTQQTVGAWIAFSMNGGRQVPLSGASLVVPCAV